MQCPRCGLINPPGTAACECGFGFCAVTAKPDSRTSISPLAGQEESLTIRLSRTKFLLLVAVVALPVTVALVLQPERWNNAEAWVKIAVAGIGAFLVIASFVMPRLFYLHMTAEGLTFQAIGNRRFFTWQEIHGFCILNRFVNFLPLGRCITFRLREDSPQRTGLQRVIGAVLPYDVSILAVFERSASEIVHLLGDWQRRHGYTGARPRETWQPSQR